MSQQRHLETLKKRAIDKERPAVTVGDETYEFQSVVWGGASPLVSLVDPRGSSSWKTAAEWTRLGAKFAGRSRSLAKAPATSTQKRLQREAQREALLQTIEDTRVQASMARHHGTRPGEKTAAELEHKIMELLDQMTGAR